MKILMSFLVLLFLALLINAKQTKNTMYLPLVHVHSANYFDEKVLAPPVLSPHARAGLAFLTEMRFGSSHVKQYLLVDTGSSLTWIQCFPCSHCFADRTYPKYLPEKSTTYRDAECETTTTKSNPIFTYFYSSEICEYKQQYADGSQIRGILAKEMVLLQTLDGGFEEVHDVYFGCNDQATGEGYLGTGILGLGIANYSIVEKFGFKFSFCIGRLRDQTSTHNLILGDGAKIQGDPTIIKITDEGHYMFQLESIIVGEKISLVKPIPVYLDTGSMMSHLSKDLFGIMVSMVRNLIGDRFIRVQYGSLLCYKIDVEEIPNNIDIGFIFAGGAELSLNVRSLFVTNGSPGTLCLLINQNTEDIDEDQNIIIGAIAMQGYNLGYDLKAKTVYFQKRNCKM